MLNEAHHVRKEGLFRDVQPEELGSLVQQNDGSDAGLEAREHRQRDEAGDEAQLQQSGREEQNSDKCRQRRRRGDELRRIAVRDHAAEFCRGQDGQCRRRADAEHAGRAQKTVDERGNESRIEADRYRQSSHGGESHRLGQDDGRSRKACHHVEPNLPWRVLPDWMWRRTEVLHVRSSAFGVGTRIDSTSASTIPAQDAAQLRPDSCLENFPQ